MIRIRMPVDKDDLKLCPLNKINNSTRISLSLYVKLIVSVHHIVIVNRKLSVRQFGILFVTELPKPVADQKWKGCQR